MGCAIAQIEKSLVRQPPVRSQETAKNKNGNARTAGAIRAFPFRLVKDTWKMVFMQRRFCNCNVLTSFWRKFSFRRGSRGGDIMRILSRGGSNQMVTKVGIGKRGIFGRFGGGESGQRGLFAQNRMEGAKNRVRRACGTAFGG